MHVRIAVVEDDKASTEAICEYVKRFTRESGEQFEVECFIDGDDIVSDYSARFDIIFLDIQMKRMDGMSTAEYIRKLDKEVILIFITNMSQYAIKGYKVGALDFLLKPVPYFAFSEQLKRSVEKLKKRSEKALLLPVENGVLKLNASDIVYIESFKHKMTIFTFDKNYTISSTLQELEKKLSGKNFFRTNKGYLVNLSHVKSVNGNSVLAGGFDIILSRARKKAFMEALAAYIGGMK